jgi:hypothetical protein
VKGPDRELPSLVQPAWLTDKASDLAMGGASGSAGPAESNMAHVTGPLDKLSILGYDKPNASEIAP